MIQFNLLPDVKLEFIRARWVKRLVMLGSVVCAGTTLALFILLFLVVNVLQKQHLKDLSKDISSSSSHLKGMQDIDKILTIQSQLKSLPDLHSKKPVSARLFGYLTQITPNQTGITKVNIDFDEPKMTVGGTADSLTTVNKFVDSMKFTTFKLAGDEHKDDEEKKAFSDVVLTNFNRDNKAATYQIDLKFDTAIFDSASDVTLVVPNIISTRSETEKPAALFQQPNSQGDR